MTTRKRRPGGGRKPQGEFAGLTAALTMRITPELRRALEREARRTAERTRRPRSLSQEVIARLKRSVDEPKEVQRVFGKPRSRALAVLVARLATNVEIFTGTSWRSDRYAFEALRRAVSVLLETLAPQGEITVPDRLRTVPSWASKWDQPEALGDTLAMEARAQLDLQREPPPRSDWLSREWYEFPRVLKDLDSEGDDR